MKGIDHAGKSRHGIMSAMGRIPAPSDIAAMQSINKVIINPWFLVAFFGTAIACLALVINLVVEWRATDLWRSKLAPA